MPRKALAVNTARSSLKISTGTVLLEPANWRFARLTKSPYWTGNSMLSISNEINLPKDWQKSRNTSFEDLAKSVENIHNQTFESSTKAVNRLATIRNYLIGFYIVEYEQRGNDRAKYGDQLLVKLEERLNTRGLNTTLFKICRKFYLTYPQVCGYLDGKGATPSHQFEISAERPKIAMPTSRWFSCQTPAPSRFAGFPHT